MAKRYARHRNYRMPEDLVRGVKKYALDHGVSESEAVRRMIHQALCLGGRTAEPSLAQEHVPVSTDNGQK